MKARRVAMLDSYPARSRGHIHSNAKMPGKLWLKMSLMGVFPFLEMSRKWLAADILER
jgi:hypothetical protein